jgi:hypothetical protein
MALNKALTTRKAGYTTGYVAVATLIALYCPYIKDYPPELTIPILSGLLNALKNLAKHRFGFDPFV